MANVRDVANVTVNDGKGLFDADGLMDTIIMDCNDAVKHCVTGQYIAFCGVMTNIVQKVAVLKEGYKAEMAGKDETILELRKANDELIEKVTGLPVDRSETILKNQD